MQFDEHLCDISHGFNRHGASRGPSAIAELVVVSCVSLERFAVTSVHAKVRSVGLSTVNRCRICSSSAAALELHCSRSVLHPVLTFRGINANEQTSVQPENQTYDNLPPRRRTYAPAGPHFDRKLTLTK